MRLSLTYIFDYKPSTFLPIAKSLLLTKVSTLPTEIDNNVNKMHGEPIFNAIQ